MKCESCGAEVTGTTCEYCGSRIVHEAPTMVVNNYYIVEDSDGKPKMEHVVEDINVSPCNRLVTLILCVFGGMLGLHHFYAGRIGMGIAYIFTGGLFGVGWIIDIIAIIGGWYEDSKRRKVSGPYMTGGNGPEYNVREMYSGGVAQRDDYSDYSKSNSLFKYESRSSQIIKWVFSAFFLFGGMTELTDNGNYVGGIVILVGTFLLSPFGYGLVRKKADVSNAAVVTVAVIVIIAGILMC